MRLSRREFTGALGFGLAGSGQVAGARKPLRIGIGTYSYHSLSMEAMVAELVRLKVDEIEMSRGEFMLLSHPKDEIFRSARALFDRAGVRCVSYYAATIHDEGEIGQAIRFAGLLGAGNITCDARPDVLKKLDARCSEARLTFGLHNHYFPQKFEYESPEDVLKALAPLSKAAGATADTGQFASCGYDPLDAVKKLASRLRLVHLKDIKAAHGEDNVIIGRGIAQIPAVMRELRQQHFGGLVAIEYEKEGPVIEDMRRAVEYARKLA